MTFHRLVPIGWTLVGVLALADRAPVGPTLLGLAIGYAVILHRVIYAAVRDSVHGQ